MECPTTAGALRTEMRMRCAKGHDVPENSRFCPWCGGAALSDESVSSEVSAILEDGPPVEPTAPPSARRQKRSRRALVVSVTTVAVLAVVTGSIVLASVGRRPSPAASSAGDAPHWTEVGQRAASDPTLVPGFYPRGYECLAALKSVTPRPVGARAELAFLQGCTDLPRGAVSAKMLTASAECVAWATAHIERQHITTQVPLWEPGEYEALQAQGFSSPSYAAYSDAAQGGPMARSGGSIDVLKIGGESDSQLRTVAAAIAITDCAKSYGQPGTTAYAGAVLTGYVTPAAPSAQSATEGSAPLATEISAQDFNAAAYSDVNGVAISVGVFTDAASGTHYVRAYPATTAGTILNPSTASSTIDPKSTEAVIWRHLSGDFQVVVVQSDAGAITASQTFSQLEASFGPRPTLPPPSLGDGTVPTVWDAGQCSKATATEVAACNLAPLLVTQPSVVQDVGSTCGLAEPFTTLMVSPTADYHVGNGTPVVLVYLASLDSVAPGHESLPSSSTATIQIYSDLKYADVQCGTDGQPSRTLVGTPPQRKGNG